MKKYKEMVMKKDKYLVEAENRVNIANFILSIEKFRVFIISLIESRRQSNPQDV